MTAWLKTELAKSIGVIANVSFINQDALLIELYQLLFGERLRNNRCDKVSGLSSPWGR